MLPRTGRRAVPALVLLVLLVCGACGRVVRGKAEDRIDAVLPRYLGPADRYETRIDAASAGAVLRGHLRLIHIVGTRVQLRPNLVVDTLTLDARSVTADPRRGTLTAVESAAFRCRISAAHLQSYLISRRLGIPDLSLETQGEFLVVRARPDLLGVVPVPVRVKGLLVPEASGDLLDFVPDRASVTILPVPRVLLSYFSRRLNPIVDLRDLPVAIHVDTAAVESGALVLTGTVPPDTLLRAANATATGN